VPGTIRLQGGTVFPDRLWKFLHLFFAFSYVGSLVVVEWNGRAARATQDWSQRAVLFQIIQFSTRVAGFGALLMLGVFGNLVAVRLGYSMRADVWLRWVNGLWLAAVAAMLLLSLPSSARLAGAARAAASGGSAEGYEKALARWRFGNVLQSVLYLALLALMVFHWHS
jgi:hypothetical protein